MSKYKCIKTGYGFFEGKIYSFEEHCDVYIPNDYEITETTKVMKSGKLWLFKSLFDQMFISIDNDRDNKIEIILK